MRQCLNDVSRRAIPVCAWLRHPTVPRPPRWRQMGPGTAYAVIHTNNTPTYENSLGPPPSCFTWNIGKRGCVFRRGGIYLNGWESGCCGCVYRRDFRRSTDVASTNPKTHGHLLKADSTTADEREVSAQSCWESCNLINIGL